MKKYHWIRLTTNFFDDDLIRVLEGEQNGYAYIVFWQKLLLKVATQKEIGILKFRENIPYTPDILAKAVNMNVDIVRSALIIFQKLSMIEINEKGEIIIDEKLIDLKKKFRK